jgi:cyclic beta-1,2-glucan synthetase
VSHSHGRLDIESLRAFVASYQATHPLLLGELWAIPIMLRLALVENLRRVISEVSAGRREKARAVSWVERMRDAIGPAPGGLVLVLADLVKDGTPMGPSFVAQLASSLQREGAPLALALSWLEHELSAQGRTLEHVLQIVGQDLAANQVSVENSIRSLRLLEATDWRVLSKASAWSRRRSERTQRGCTPPWISPPAIPTALRSRPSHD